MRPSHIRPSVLIAGHRRDFDLGCNGRGLAGQESVPLLPPFLPAERPATQQRRRRLPPKTLRSRVPPLPRARRTLLPSPKNYLWLPERLIQQRSDDGKGADGKAIRHVLFLGDYFEACFWRRFQSEGSTLSASVRCSSPVGAVECVKPEQHARFQLVDPLARSRQQELHFFCRGVERVNEAPERRGHRGGELLDVFRGLFHCYSIREIIGSTLA